MSEFLWKLKNVELPGHHRPRLSDVTLDIETGSTAILGYSGAGKTSLLNILAGMEHGYRGQVLQQSDPGRSASVPLFWVPQDFGLWPGMSAAEHVQAVLHGDADPGLQTWLSEQNVAPAGSAVDKILQLFDLSDRQQATVDQLSRGEQARLSVARSLAARPAVLLMDEPLAHVDPVRRPKYWRIIQTFLRTTETSLVFSTHQPETALKESQQVLCLNQGRVIYMGATNRLYHSPPTAEAGSFLGPLNWFESDQAVVWLGCEQETVLRPEKLRLTEDPDGPFEVLSFQFGGSYSETELRPISDAATTTAASRQIVHQSGPAPLQVGQRVQLQW